MNWSFFKEVVIISIGALIMTAYLNPKPEMISKAEYEANPELVKNLTENYEELTFSFVTINNSLKINTYNDEMYFNGITEVKKWNYVSIGFQGFPIEVIAGFIDYNSCSLHECILGDERDYKLVDYSGGINIVGEDFKSVLYQDSEAEKPFSESWTADDAIKGAKLTFISKAVKSDDESVWQIAKTWIKFHWKYDEDNKNRMTLYIISAVSLEHSPNKWTFGLVSNEWGSDSRIFFYKKLKKIQN